MIHSGMKNIFKDNLKSLVEYLPDTGKIKWISPKIHHLRKDDRKLHLSGYRHITINGVWYPEHRLAWFLYYGIAPEEGKEIDHINGIRHDNRIINLRLVTRGQNTRNSPRRRSGEPIGVRKIKRPNASRPYRAIIYCMNGVKGSKKHIGYYSTEEQAHAAIKSIEELIEIVS